MAARRAAAWLIVASFVFAPAAAAGMAHENGSSAVVVNSGDSAAAQPADQAARLILSRCGGNRPRYDCVSAAVLELVDRSGPAYAMAVLEELTARQPTLRPDAHGLAHAIGIRAYQSRATLSEVFATCPATHLSGCYHGVMQAYFLELRESRTPVTSSLLDSLCEDHRSAGGGLYFQCVHGVGHGLMALHGNDLPGSLRSCDLLAARSNVENCHAGAFMENVIVATHPHHSALAHAADVRRDDHAGHGAAGGEHGHGEADGDHDHGDHDSPDGGGGWVPLSRHDHQYPCSVLDPLYQAGCYNMQSSAMLFLNSGDAAKTAADCERAPADFVVACLRSLGRDVFALSGGDYARGALNCRALGPARELHCITGFAHTVMNIRGMGEDGLQFCENVAGAQQRGVCYSAVGEMLFALGAPPARRAELCALAAAEHRGECAAGAGVPAGESPR